jgi:hypothetical protein
VRPEISEYFDALTGIEAGALKLDLIADIGNDEHVCLHGDGFCRRIVGVFLEFFITKGIDDLERKS